VNKTTLVIATLVSVSLHVLGYAQVGPSPWGNRKVSPWKVDFGVSIVDRESIADARPVIQSTPGGSTFMDGTALGTLRTGAGPDLRVEYIPGTSVTTVEFRGRYFGFEDRNSTPPGIFFLSSGGPLQFSDLDGREDSSYLAWEFNAKRKLFQGLDVLAGIRFNNFDDNINIAGSGSQPQNFPFPNIPFTHNLDVSTSNPHLGLQLGVDWDLNLGGGLTLDTTIRTGGYVNFGSQDTRIINSLTQQNTLTSLEEDDFFFSGEIGVRLNFDLLDDRLAGYIGGEYYFIDDMLTASRQAIDPGSPVISGRQSLKMSGLVFGFTSRF